MSKSTHLKKLAESLPVKFQKQIGLYLGNYSKVAGVVRPSAKGGKGKARGKAASAATPIGFGLGFKRIEHGGIELVARYYVR